MSTYFLQTSSAKPQTIHGNKRRTAFVCVICKPGTTLNQKFHEGKSESLIPDKVIVIAKPKVLQLLYFQVMSEENKSAHDQDSVFTPSVPPTRQHDTTPTTSGNYVKHSDRDKHNDLHSIESLSTVSVLSEFDDSLSLDQSDCYREPSIPTQLQFGSIAVQNTSDVTFGNKTYIQGPVTMKQCSHIENLSSKPSKKPRTREFILKRKRYLGVLGMLLTMIVTSIVIFSYWRRYSSAPDFSHPGTISRSKNFFFLSI